MTETPHPGSQTPHPDTAITQPDDVDAPGVTDRTAPLDQPSPASPAPASTSAPDTVAVRRRWLYAGGAVAALAVIGLSFGGGYLVGDAAHAHHRDGRPGHARMMPGLDEERGEGLRPGRGGRPWMRGPAEVPDSGGSEADGQDAPQTPSPERTAPATPG